MQGFRSGCFLNIVTNPLCFFPKPKEFHTNNTNHNFVVNHGIINGRSLREQFLSILTTTVNKTTGEDELIYKETIPSPFKFFEYKPMLLGPCNGFYLYGIGENLFLWNPSISKTKFRPLPSSTVERLPFLERLHYRNIGFGFDPKTKDYKVVQLVKNIAHFGSHVEHQVDLYSLKNDSWEQIHDDFCDISWDDECVYTYNNGVFYWTGREWKGQMLIRLSFDFTNHVFEKLHLPYISDDLSDEIALINGLPAAFISYNPTVSEQFFDIWMMNENGVEKSWIKQTSFGPISDVARPLGFWNDSGLLLEDVDGGLLLYDCKSQNTKHLQLWGVRGELQVVNYEENLGL